MIFQNWADGFSYIPKSERKEKTPVTFHFNHPTTKELASIRSQSGIKFKGDFSSPDSFERVSEACYTKDIENDVKILKKVIKDVDNFFSKDGKKYNWTSNGDIEKERMLVLVMRQCPEWIDELIENYISGSEVTEEQEKN